jgi:RNA polymerase sigma-70 factor (ECF subfamily)
MVDNVGPTQNNPDTLSDQEAITSLKQGNIKGLAALVQRYQVKAVHTALLITHNRRTAEDVVQDAFLQVHRKIDQFDERRPFSPWFLRIVINKAKKSLRGQRKYLALDDPQDGNGFAEWLMDPGKSPEMLSESAELSERVWQAIGQLKPHQREAIVLKYFLDRKEREIVESLGRPLTTVKWWLYSARQRLREILTPAGKGELEKEEASHE